MENIKFNLYARKNLKKYVINKLCGVYRIIKDEPSLIKYNIELFYVLLNFYFLKRIVIPQIEFLITTNCTLNCKYCSNFIPLINKKYSLNLSENEFENYLQNLLKNVWKLNSLILVGGEPLLNPKFSEILLIALKNKKIEKVYIYTNGTILFNEKSVILLKKYRKKVHVFVSNYSRNEELKNKLKIDEILMQLKQNHINYTFNEKLYWIKQNPIKNYNRSKEDNKEIYSQCRVPSVTSVLGKIYTCPKAAVSSILNLKEFNSDEYLDMNKVITQKDIINFYTRDENEICGYCEGPNSTKCLTIAAEQLKE
jgi:organic radical activating enzyme